jgi:hypothetical protein
MAKSTDLKTIFNTTFFHTKTIPYHQGEYFMATGFINKVKGFILDPTQTLILHRNESLGDSLRYFITFFVIYGVVTGIIVGLLVGMNTVGGVGAAEAGLGAIGIGGLAALGILGMIMVFIVFIIVFGIIALFIGGIMLHICVFIAGGRKGLTTTIRALIYSLTPNLLFGWIPLIGFLAGFWSLALGILAIKELHEISTTRAFIAVFLPAILIAIVSFFVLAALVTATTFTSLY